MVIDEILGPQGVYAALHDRRSRSVPAPASMSGVLGVAVVDSEAPRARRLLAEARRDEALLTGDGEIVEEMVV
jgi:hypothetical protein